MSEETIGTRIIHMQQNSRMLVGGKCLMSYGVVAPRLIGFGAYPEHQEHTLDEALADAVERIEKEIHAVAPMEAK